MSLRSKVSLRVLPNLLAINSLYTSFWIGVCRQGPPIGVPSLLMTSERPRDHEGWQGSPLAAFLRLTAIGGESQQETLRQPLATALAGKYLSAASSSWVIQPRQLVTVFNAVRMSAATDAAEIDLNVGPPIACRWKKSAWRNQFWGILMVVCMLARSTCMKLLGIGSS